VVEPIPAVRIVATPAALDGAMVPNDRPTLRLAPDELLVIGDGLIEVADHHAIATTDAGWCGAWLDATAAEAFLSHACEWELPTQRPAFAQGMVAHLAVKLWFESGRTLILVPRPMAAELADRLGEQA
jgi:hypothetical protein